MHFLQGGAPDSFVKTATSMFLCPLLLDLFWLPTKFQVRRWPRAAQWMQWLTFLWIGLGMWILLSASYSSAHEQFGDGLYYARRQILWITVGLTYYAWILRQPIEKLLLFGRVGLLISWLSLAYTLIGGVSINGSARWLAIGPLLFQPSEIVKPFLVLETASLFADWNQASDRNIRLTLLLLLIFAILLQPNLSTAALCAILLWSMGWAANFSADRLTQIAWIGILVISISLFFRSYQRDRMISFWNPWQYSSQEGYQLIQSLLAIGSGGSQGVGWGLSHQKLFYLPIESTDFIFSVFAEESGLMGSCMLILFLSIYARTGFIMIDQIESSIPRLIATGSLLLLVGQSILNMSVCLGLFPTTGVPLPFFSYGGNSILASCALAGLLVRMGKSIPMRIARPQPQDN